MTLVVPTLPECVESPLYVPVTVTDPAVVEVKVTEHVPLASVPGLPVNVPLRALKVTVPVGVDEVPGEASVTVAVHVVD